MSGVHLDDGAALQSSWDLALSHSILHFRQLVASSSSSSWKPLPIAYPSSSGNQTPPPVPPLLEGFKGKTTLHKRSLKTGDVFRAVFESDAAALGDELGIDTFRGAIVEPGSRGRWDRLVDSCSTLDVLDTNTRIVHTRYRLGWPSSPRDSITIQRHYVDEDSLICVATSLPRSKHEPAYLKPCPPYVRAHVGIMAWLVQLLPSDNGRKKRLRMSCHFNWTPNGQWAIGASVQTHLPGLLRSLRDYAIGEAVEVPEIVWMSPGVSVDDMNFDATRVLFGMDYSVVRVEDQAGPVSGDEGEDRGKATVVWRLSRRSSWDIDFTQRTGELVDPETLEYRAGPRAGSPHESPFLYFRLDVPPPPPTLYIKRYRITLERTMGNPDDVRFNGSLCALESDVETPICRLSPTSLLGDSSSVLSDMSLKTNRTLDQFGGIGGVGMGRAGSILSLESGTGTDVQDLPASPKRTEQGQRQRSVSIDTTAGNKGVRSKSQDKTVASLIKRNYIHFTALLQEPEVKWRRISESKGVTLYSLNSMDKTLAIHRVEAVFVGVSLWDLFAILMTWGARSAWDKAYGNATLLEHVNEMTELWRVSQKGRQSRDLLRTTYKRHDAMHIFSFTPDASLFPSVPFSADSSQLREEMSLQGWSLERLSPTTIHVTLIEQVDARALAAKSIPQQMHGAMAGLGETAIKTGGPPVISRLSGAKIAASRYDVEKANVKFIYEAAVVRTITVAPKTVVSAAMQVDDSTTTGSRRGSETPTIVDEEKAASMECQIRCDPERWASSLEVVVDPPPSSFSVLKRHSLTENGGLWLTIEHENANSPLNRKVTITVQARPAAGLGREKTTVLLNGTAVDIDKADLASTDVTAFKKQKRSQVTRRSLDQPVSVPLLRRRPTAVPSLKLPEGDEPFPETETPDEFVRPLPETPTWAGSISGWINTAAGSAKSVVIAPSGPSPETNKQQPFDAAAGALERLVRIHIDRFSESTTADDQWMVASRNGNAIVEKKVLPFVSDSLPVYRSSRIIQGSSAEDVSAVISSSTHRKSWDAAKMIESKLLAAYGEGVHVQFTTNKMAFPYKNRAFQTVNIVARAETGGPPSPVPNFASTGDAALIFHASTSNFDATPLGLDPTKYNPLNMPLGNVVLEGWILETLDPYSHDQFPIPSTRCMHVCAIDFGIPLAMNNAANAALPYRILGVEKLLNAESRLPMLVNPASGIIVPKTLLKARKLGKDTKYGLVGFPETTIVSLTHDVDGVTQAVVRVMPVSQRPRRGSAFPADWYNEEAAEVEAIAGQPDPVKPSHTRSASAWSRLTRTRAISQQLVRGLSETSKHIDDIVPIAKMAAVLEMIVEIPAGIGERFAIVVQAYPESSPGPVIPLPFETARTDLAQERLNVEVEKTALPVLRGALTDNQAYLIRIRLSSGSDSQDPLGRPPTDVSHPSPRQELPEGGVVVALKLQKLPRDGSGEVRFVRDGQQIHVESSPSVSSPSNIASRVDARVRSWSKLKRVDPAQDGASLVDHLRLDFAPLAVNSGSRRLATTPSVAPPALVDPDEVDKSTEAAVLPSAIESPGPDSGIVKTPTETRPRSQRMNSIYTYLTKPPRFSWPATPIAQVVNVPDAPTNAQGANMDSKNPAASTETKATSPLKAIVADNRVVPPAMILALLATAVLFFLLGSLIRSLLGEHQDYYTVLPSGAISIEPEWQEMTRVLELKVWKWHLMVAFLRGRAT